MKKKFSFKWFGLVSTSLATITGGIVVADQLASLSVPAQTITPSRLNPQAATAAVQTDFFNNLVSGNIKKIDSGTKSFNLTNEAGVTSSVSFTQNDLIGGRNSRTRLAQNLNGVTNNLDKMTVQEFLNEVNAIIAPFKNRWKILGYHADLQASVMSSRAIMLDGIFTSSAWEYPKSPSTQQEKLDGDLYYWGSITTRARVSKEDASGNSIYSALQNIRDIGFLQQQVGTKYSQVDVLSSSNVPRHIYFKFPQGANCDTVLIPPQDVWRDQGNGVYEFTIADDWSNSPKIYPFDDINNQLAGVNRVVARVRVERVPDLLINPVTYEVINAEYATRRTEASDYLYDYFSGDIPESGSYQKLQSASDFESARAAAVQKVRTLRNSPKYKASLDRYQTNFKDTPVEQIVENVDNVATKYNVERYTYTPPRRILGKYQNYVVSYGNISQARVYTGVGELFGQMLEFDPTSGVKTKKRADGSPYAATDQAAIGLKLRLDPHFVALLQKIDAVNAVILSARAIQEAQPLGLYEDEFMQLIKPLWNFSFDPSTAKTGQDLITQLHTYRDDGTVSPLLTEIRELLGEQRTGATAAQLAFYHDLPELISTYLRNTQLMFEVSQSGKAPQNPWAFTANQFVPVTIDDASQKANAEMFANNTASLTFSRVILQNLSEPEESRQLFDWEHLLRDYPDNNTLTIKNKNLSYVIDYQADGKSMAPVAQTNTNFIVTDNLDTTGFVASDYAEPNTVTNGKSILTAVMQANLRGDLVLPLIQEESTRVLSANWETDPAITEQGALVMLVSRYGLSLAPNDVTGEFYALISITNSNALSSYGTVQDPVIIPGAMWFVKQNPNSATREYLVKFYAAKRTIRPDAIDIGADVKAGTISLTAQIANKAVGTATLTLLKDSQANYARSQTLSLKLGRNTQFDLLKVQQNNQLQHQLTDALSEFGLAVNTNTISFNSQTQGLKFDVVPFTQSTISLAYAGASGKLVVQPVLNGQKQTATYALSYKIGQLADGSYKLNLAFDYPPSQTILARYFEPFDTEIIDALTKQINADQDRFVVSNLKVNFKNLSAQADITPINQTPFNIDLPDWVIPVVIATALIVVAAAISGAVFGILKRKKKQRLVATTVLDVVPQDDSQKLPDEQPPVSKADSNDSEGVIEETAEAQTTKVDSELTAPIKTSTASDAKWVSPPVIKLKQVAAPPIRHRQAAERLQEQTPAQAKC